MHAAGKPMEFKTNLLCFDQKNFINGVGVPLVVNVRDELWRPTFSIGNRFALLADVQPRNDMPVCLLSCLLLLQSNNSTEFCRGNVGNSNDSLHSSILPVFRLRF